MIPTLALAGLAIGAILLACGLLRMLAQVADERDDLMDLYDGLDD